MTKQITLKRGKGVGHVLRRKEILWFLSRSHTLRALEKKNMLFLLQLLRLANYSQKLMPKLSLVTP